MKTPLILTVLTLIFGFLYFLNDEELPIPGGITLNQNQESQIKWKFKITNNVKNLTITDEALYYGSEDGYFYSLDSKSGLQNWKVKPNGIPCTSTVASRDIVYFGTKDGQINALDKHTGQKVWHVDIWGLCGDSAIIISPTLSNGLLFFGVYDNRFYAVDAKTGLQKWTFKTYVSWGTWLWKLFIKLPILTNARVKAPVPVIHDGVIFFSGDSEYLYAVDIYTGKEKWRFYMGSYMAVTPVIVDNIMYFGTFTGDFHAVDIANGKQTWSFKTGYPIYCSPSSADGTIYLGNVAGYAYALDANTGTEKWRIKAPRSINSSLATANGVVYFSSDDCNIYGVDTEGHGKWKYQTGGEVRSSIAMIDGVLYFGSNYDYLYALQVPSIINGDSGGRS